MMGRQTRASTAIMRRWEPNDPGGSCLHHTIGRYRALPHDRTDRENAGALDREVASHPWWRRALLLRCPGIKVRD
jgi:hypothetical protein